MRTERRKIGSYPEFSCKYIDWTVSNECRTVWRGVYADLPVIVMRPQHLGFDIPDWRWKTQLLPIGVVRWTWKEERWTVSVPVFVTDPNDDSRASGSRSRRKKPRRSPCSTTACAPWIGASRRWKPTAPIRATSRATTAARST